MTPVRVKICGITNRSVLESAISAGADAVGFVLVESPRRVELDRAVELARVVPPLVSAVAVFRNVSAAEVAAVARTGAFTHVQADAASCGGLGVAVGGVAAGGSAAAMPFIRVCRVGSAEWQQLADGSAPVDAMYLVEGPRSGAGEVIDWRSVAPVAGRYRIVLAGGLNPENVGDAVRTVRPFAVDVSSGVESSPGTKDLARIRSFIGAVRRAEQLP